jgi:predicted extracellular nuclease
MFKARKEKEGSAPLFGRACSTRARRNLKLSFLVYIGFEACIASQAFARSGRELNICSQNLETYSPLRGILKERRTFTALSFAKKEESLIGRALAADCDLVAVQEAVGRTEEEALNSVQRLAALFSLRLNKKFAAIIAGGNDPFLHVGIIYNSKRMRIGTRLTPQLILPKLSSQQRPRTQLREPLDVVFRFKAREKALLKELRLIAFHLKSKRGGFLDPAKISWEGARMEAAEAIRASLNERRESRRSITVVLGDRNSGRESATTALLKGESKFADFQNQPGCSVLKDGKLLCEDQQALHKPALASIFENDRLLSRYIGTFAYQKKFEWLDDILIPPGKLKYLETCGVIWDYPQASDHAMVVGRIKILP